MQRELGGRQGKGMIFKYLSEFWFQYNIYIYFTFTLV